MRDLYSSNLNCEVFILQGKISPLLEDIEVKSSDMRFATERPLAAAVSKLVLAEAGAELTFDLYIL